MFDTIISLCYIENTHHIQYYVQCNADLGYLMTAGIRNSMLAHNTTSISQQFVLLYWLRTFLWDSFQYKYSAELRKLMGPDKTQN